MECNKEQALIFDLDGTLIDSSRDLAESVNHMLRMLELPERSPGEVASFVGHGVTDLIRRSLGPEHLERTQEGLTVFMEHYREHCLDHTRPYEGVREVLAEVERHYSLFVVTNKNRDLSVKILEGLSLLPRFCEVIGGDTLPRRKPSPVSLEYIHEQYGTSPRDMIVVGDSATDVDMGCEAGALTIFCTYGIGRTDRFPAHHTIGKITELPSLLDRIRKSS